ncbi:4-hydroxy-3-methylbut-2-enyl diphosphate reductase [Desulfococcaceae bacterium HSG8]|nr:4-hydroxy-3-methylbut-2-enyl diphosphate reductase [Desulfococcaceae bacterium HSG8]
MKILIAKTAGFCMGVRRAVEMVLDAPDKHEGPIFTYGPLIHNPQVLKLLKKKGISVINDIPALENGQNGKGGRGTVLIRAHGVPPRAKDELRERGFTVIDATCPRVIKVQTIIRKHAGKGYEIIIIGDRDHPEVIGLLGYAGDKGHVAGTLEDLESLPGFDRAIIVAQTTQNTIFFEKVKQRVVEKFPHYKIFDTICDSTEKRQAEVKHLAASVDALIVVGGYNSGNTQRLAEIARQTGKPAYHIETGSELDPESLSSARSIAITAGASTPNWIIKRIYRTIETLPSHRDHFSRRMLFTLQRTLLLTNIYVSLGAGCLCYACSKLQGISDYRSYVLISMLYVQSMHIFNNLTGTESDHYNDPDRAIFYDKYKVILAVLAFFSGAMGLTKAYSMGLLPFLILLVMSITGLSYNLRLVPEGLMGGKYRRIRDIPGSKTLLIALAWGVVTSVFPPLSVSAQVKLGTLPVFIWAAGMAFVRTAFFDILDMQGDRIVGKDTIPILLGEKRTMGFLKSVLIAITVILFLSGALGFTSGLGFFLVICPIFLFIIILAHEQGYLLAGMRLEFLVETHFILAGMITICWSLIVRHS